MSAPARTADILQIYVRYVASPDTFPSAVVQKGDLIAIYSVKLSAVVVVNVDVAAVDDTPAAIVVDIGRFV